MMCVQIMSNSRCRKHVINIFTWSLFHKDISGYLSYVMLKLHSLIGHVTLKEIVFLKNGPTPASFFVYFRLLKQTLQILQQI